MNALQLRSGIRLFHAMLVPRITLAHGRLLQTTPALEASEHARGVLSDGLFIGEAVVHAYQIERSSSGSMVSLADEHAATLRAIRLRGVREKPFSAMEQWQTGALSVTHDGVVDFPWILLRPHQPDDEWLWADDEASVVQKVQLLDDLWELSFSEFVVRSLPNATIKHFGAAKRHLAEVVAALSVTSRRTSRGPRPMFHGVSRTLPLPIARRVAWIERRSVTRIASLVFSDPSGTL